VSTGITYTRSKSELQVANMWLQKRSGWKVFKFLIGVLLCASFASAAPSTTDEILLESFDHPIHTWTEMNDPVMGGRSTGSFHVGDSVGVFEGEVVDVPFLHAPGFIQARTTDSIAYPDVSHCSAIKIVVRTKNPEYKGYRFSFGNAHAPGGKWHAYGYKANLLNVPKVEYGEVVIPFSDFTDFWDDATGDPIHTCHENSLYCPDRATLSNMRAMAVWGEGEAGKVSLDIRSVWAVGCSAVNPAKAPQEANRATVATRLSRHFALGWSHQMSLSTLFWNWFAT
jgi:Complex I intermediate-associated protein 30 (CIA30)